MRAKIAIQITILDDADKNNPYYFERNKATSITSSKFYIDKQDVELAVAEAAKYLNNFAEKTDE